MLTAIKYKIETRMVAIQFHVKTIKEERRGRTLNISVQSFLCLLLVCTAHKTASEAAKCIGANPFAQNAGLCIVTSRGAAMDQSGNNPGKSRTQVYELSKGVEDTIKRIQVFYVTSASASAGY